MPRYTLERNGEQFTEYMSWEALQTYLKDNPDVQQVITAPFVLGAEFIKTHRKGDKFREQFLDKKIKALNPTGLSGPGLR